METKIQIETKKTDKHQNYKPYSRQQRSSIKRRKTAQKNY